MRGKINVFTVLLVFIVILFLIFYIKKHATYQKVTNTPIYIPPKIPYNYNISYKIIGPGKIKLIINITKKGNVFQKLIINISKVLINGKVQQIRKEEIRLSKKEIIEKNYYVFPDVSKDKEIIINIYDTFRRKSEKIILPIIHHNYSIDAKLINNYSLEIDINVKNYSIITDNLKINVKLINSFTTKKIASINLRIYPEEIPTSQIYKYYSYVIYKNGSSYKIYVFWKEIGDINGTIKVDIIDESFNQELASFNFTVTPQIVNLNETNKIDNTKLLVKPIPIDISFDHDIINFEYVEYGKPKKINLTCKFINNMYMCYGIVNVIIENRDEIGHDIRLDPNSIICENNLGAKYSWKEVKGLLGDQAYHLEPMQSRNNFIYCLLPRTTKLAKIYLKIFIDNKLHELVINF